MTILAILVASISSFLLGGLWYSPILFLKQWTEVEPKPIGSHSKLIFVYSFLFSLIAASGYYLLTRSFTSILDFLYYSVMIGVCFVAASLGINYQFANRKFSLFLIDAGYHIAQFITFGIIFWLFS